jgi:hypothetical protein
MESIGVNLTVFTIGVISFCVDILFIAISKVAIRYWITRRALSRSLIRVADRLYHEPAKPKIIVKGAMPAQHIIKLKPRLLIYEFKDEE